MGAVYHARDTKLNREVAIKVLLPAVANDPERLADHRLLKPFLCSLRRGGRAHSKPRQSGARSQRTARTDNTRSGYRTAAIIPCRPQGF